MKKFKLTLIALALAAGAASAQQAPMNPKADGIPVTKLSRLRVFADEQEMDQQSKLQYAQLLNEAKQKEALVPESDPQVKRLRAIAARIVPNAQRWNPAAANWQWEVNLLNSDQVNAFCMPGGRIAFYTGILAKLNLTDDEVAMVMGHEIAHALREHARKRAVQSTAVSLASKLGGAVLSSYLGIDPRITDAGANVAGQLTVMKFSRGDETESDLVGIDLAARAGFDPRAGVALWQKMGAVNARQPMEFLSTHPSGNSRIQDMQKQMPLVLPVYARQRGLDVNKLPPYQTSPLPKS
ncbi:MULTISPECIES: M48 family metallopeptidase [unclassified Duganella]|uniref:M48 family metallopeptidase n=1 Tax=unclassified Duganella TaxID=2636909 RepID=UPI0006F7ED07|nr:MULTISPECIES: M48 family metallopeptidase [unclassified Duganella]KQV55068.1 peptidase M48 [Duganella sp. Root336D2]KRB94359.1 peptidase M48 [Duganella sp. Root198D2]